MTPDEIARRLTPAQKRALLWLPGDRDTARNGRVRGAPYRITLIVLRDAGPLAFETHNQSGWWRLTPLGQQVRAIVEQEAGDE